MRFHKIKFANFFSFGPKEEVLDLSVPGLYLILGANGVGKSVIIDGITFALFGNVIKKVNIGEVVNEQIKNNTKVSLEFEINGTIYWIDRYREHIIYKNDVRVFKDTYNNEGLISKADNKDTQELIDQLIKVNYKAFINAVALAQETVSGFLENSSAKKREVIESVLQLDLFVKYHFIAQEKRKISARKLERIDIEISNIEKSIENYKISMQQYADSCINQKKENDKKIEELQNELTTLEHINVDHELKIIEEVNKINEDVELKQSEITALKSQVELKGKEIETITKSKNEHDEVVKTQQRLIKKNTTTYNTNMKELENLLAEIKQTEENPDKCPLCKNVINLEDITAWIINKKKDHADKVQKTDQELVEIEQEKGQLAQTEKKIDELKSHIAILNTELNDINSQIDEKEKALENIKIPTAMDEKDVREISTKKQNIQTQINILSAKEFVDKDYLSKQMDAYRNYRDELKQKNDEKKKLLIKTLILSFWENSFSSKPNSMKSWCINNIIGFFNSKVKSYVDRFFNGDVMVQFDNELNEKISFKESNRSFGQFSTGQKRRLNIAILFALNALIRANISSKFNIMFLDEILSNHLDDYGISTVLELLEEIKENGGTVYIIDHRDNFKNYSFNRIDVYKDEKEFSHIQINNE